MHVLYCLFFLSSVYGSEHTIQILDESDLKERLKIVSPTPATRPAHFLRNSSSLKDPSLFNRLLKFEGNSPYSDQLYSIQSIFSPRVIHMLQILLSSEFFQARRIGRNNKIPDGGRCSMYDRGTETILYLVRSMIIPKEYPIRILSVGAGFGHLERLLPYTRSNLHLTITDGIQEAVAQARKEFFALHSIDEWGSKTHFFPMLVEELTDKETYDLVINTNMLHLLGHNEKIRAIRRLYDAVAPQGLLVLTLIRNNSLKRDLSPGIYAFPLCSPQSPEPLSSAEDWRVISTEQMSSPSIVEPFLSQTVPKLRSPEEAKEEDFLLSYSREFNFFGCLEVLDKERLLMICEKAGIPRQNIWIDWYIFKNTLGTEFQLLDPQTPEELRQKNFSKELPLKTGLMDGYIVVIQKR